LIFSRSLSGDGLVKKASAQVAPSPTAKPLAVSTYFSLTNIDGGFLSAHQLPDHLIYQALFYVGDEPFRGFHGDWGFAGSNWFEVKTIQDRIRR